jgi:LuxR family maltose regulon positive regulatory protein
MLRRAAYRRDASGYLKELLSVANAELGAPVSPLESLSERELEVLELIAEGLTNKEVGDRLFITTGTVKVHASHIYRKLGVSGRIQAVAWARELGLL